MKKKSIKTKNLVLSNIPNFLTISRIVLAFVVMYLIFTRANIASVISVFLVGALTDWFDGYLARKFKWESEFGRRADMVADRFLWGGTILAFVIVYGMLGMINWLVGLQIFLLMTREIIGLPFALHAFFSGNPLPQTRYIAKLTTFLQSFALPAIMLNVYYPIWIYASLPLSIACGIAGFKCALYYIKDSKKGQESKK